MAGYRAAMSGTGLDRRPPLWDGHTAERIAAVLQKYPASVDARTGMAAARSQGASHAAATTVLGRLRDELRDQAQASVVARLSARAARRDGPGRERRASLDALWARQMTAPFFLHPADREPYADAFRARYPDAASRRSWPRPTARCATSSICSGRASKRSAPRCRGTRLQDRPRTGRSQYCRDIEYIELDRPTDVKVPWELSRCQHFTAPRSGVLADRRRAIRARSSSPRSRTGSRANPFAYSVNWACAMDVALRAVSWIWGFYFMAGSPACARSARFARAFLRSLFMHGEFIVTHLETSDVNGNHYLCDGVGLVFLGLFFRHTAAGRRWLARGRAHRRATRSSSSRRRTASTSSSPRPITGSCSKRFSRLPAARAARRAGAGSAAWRGWSACSSSSRPTPSRTAWRRSSATPTTAGCRSWARRRSTITATCCRPAPCCSRGATSKPPRGRFWDESFWLLGPDGAGGVRPADRRPPSAPRRSAFPAGGFYVLRSPSAHVVVDCGEVGMRGRGGHGHNDILSFELVSERHQRRHRLRRLPLHRVARVAEPVSQHRLSQRRCRWTARS